MPPSEPLLLLPGIIMPAGLRYRPLLEALGDDVHGVPKELFVYSVPEPPPPGYSIDAEVADVLRAAEAAGFERFHLYGHSAGGAVAIAFAAADGDRLLSLALDEPAFDFTDAERVAGAWSQLDAINALPPPERIVAFLRMQLRPGVEPPPRPEGPSPAWMGARPAGIDAFTAAARRHSISNDAIRAFDGPVYYSYGSLSSLEWENRRDRLAALFPDFTAEPYEGLHHLNTSHQAEPERVADALRKVWARAATVPG
jgi:pimeloyl-ACP methyl ester carboxylesterase